MSQSAAMQQVNVRIDARLKREAEDVLSLMGSSATELVRSAYQKIARGASDYLEAMSVLKGSESNVRVVEDSPLLGGWAIAQNYYQAVGCDSSPAAMDERSWDEVYEEAMVSHFASKGMLQ